MILLFRSEIRACGPLVQRLILEDFLAVDAEGFCQKAITGQYILAMALASATAKGDIVRVAIIHAGYEA